MFKVLFTAHLGILPIDGSPNWFSLLLRWGCLSVQTTWDAQLGIHVLDGIETLLDISGTCVVKQIERGHIV